MGKDGSEAISYHAGSTASHRMEGIQTVSTGGKRSRGKRPPPDLKEYRLNTSPSLQGFQASAAKPLRTEPAYSANSAPTARSISRARVPSSIGVPSATATERRPTRFTSSPAAPQIGVGRGAHRPPTASSPHLGPHPTTSRQQRLAPNHQSPEVDAAQHPPTASRQPDARFEAFMNRVGRAPQPAASAQHGYSQPHYAVESHHQRPSRSRTPSVAAPAREPPSPEMDQLDADFILAFAREHQLEMAAEITRELAGRSGGTSQPAVHAISNSERTPRTPQIPFEAGRGPQQQQLQLQHAPSSTSAPPRGPGQASLPSKPPRPPRSERRTTHSPGAPLPAQQAPSRDHTLGQASAIAQSSYKQDARSLPAGAFDDAPEPDPQHRPQSTRRNRRPSAASPALPHLSQYYQGDINQVASIITHDLSRSHHPSASPLVRSLRNDPADLSVNKTATFEDIVPDAPDPSQDDFERDRRLSSLLKGLGIPGLDSDSPYARRDSVPTALRESLVQLKEDREDQTSAAQPVEGKKSFLVEPAQVAASACDQVAGAGEQDDWGSCYPDSPKRERRQSVTASMAHRSQPPTSPAPRHSHQHHPPSPDQALQDSRGLVFDQTHPARSAGRQRSKSSGGTRAALRTDSLAAMQQPVLPPARWSGYASLDPRASFGVTDSVLASILASDSFCLPSGMRMSTDQLAARLSVDRHALRASIQQRLSVPPLSPGSPFLTSSVGSSRVSSMQYSAVPLSTGDSRQSWGPDTPDTQYFGDHGYGEEADYRFGETYKPDPRNGQSTQQPETSLRFESYTSGQPEPYPQQHFDPNDLRHLEVVRALEEAEQREAVESQAQPAEIPIASSAPEKTPEKRTRALSISAFQRLSSSFSGSTSKSKGRKRLPSFFGGGKDKPATPAVSRIESGTTASRAASPVPSVLQPVPKVAGTPGTGRKRALTGPACLIDIANAVTGSPDFSQAPSSSYHPTLQQSGHHLISPLPSDKTWRSTIPPAIYDEISRLHSAKELRRQEVIYELSQTEESFVNGLRGVVKIFSHPLRTPQGRWIAGVPDSVSRLLDWLDDIVRLHSRLVLALQQCRASQGVVLLRLAEAILPFIPQLQVHQPFLVRFDAVVRDIEEMTQKPDSEFGEFVRMQQGLPECGSMTLSSFLLKPVQRLMKYPLFFKQLCDLSSPNHPDHGDILTLLNVTDGIIRVMQEVKVREEEYGDLKEFSSKISGMPTGMSLARRDRRLLAHGMLRRIHLSERELAALEITSQPCSAGMSRAGRHSPASFLSDGPSSLSGASTPGSLRPLSTVSSKSSSTRSFSTMPSRSGQTADFGSSGLTAHNPYFPASTTVGSVSMSRRRQASISSSLSGFGSASGTGGRSPRTAKTKETPIQAFVFNDLVVFATKHADGLRGGLMKGSKSNLKAYAKEEKGAKYRVVDDWGAARILSVTDVSDRTGHEHLLALELLPVWTESDSVSFTPSSAALATTIYVTTSDFTSRNVPLSRQAQLQERAQFVRAFEQSYIATMRSLVFPDGAGEGRNRRTGDDGSGRADLARKYSRAGLLASSSFAAASSSSTSVKATEPSLPKSPSEQALARSTTARKTAKAPGGPGSRAARAVHLSSALSGQRSADDETQEREWWAMRFNKVRAELAYEGSDTGLLALAAEQLDDGSGAARLDRGGLEHVSERVRAAEREKQRVMDQVRNGLVRKKAPSPTPPSLYSHPGASADEETSTETETVYDDDDNDDGAYREDGEPAYRRGGRGREKYDDGEEEDISESCAENAVAVIQHARVAIRRPR